MDKIIYFFKKVLWRLPGFALILIGISIAYVGVLFCYGIKRASGFWKDVM
jgi:hypothetical protein